MQWVLSKEMVSLLRVSSSCRERASLRTRVTRLIVGEEVAAILHRKPQIAALLQGHGLEFVAHGQVGAQLLVIADAIGGGMDGQ